MWVQMGGRGAQVVGSVGRGEQRGKRLRVLKGSKGEHVEGGGLRLRAQRNLFAI